MKFDLTISWAVMLGFAGLIVTAIGAIISLNRRISDMEIKLDLIFDWWRKMWEPTMPIPPANVLRKKFRRHIPDEEVH